jgi:hypothetical protein
VSGGFSGALAASAGWAGGIEVRGGALLQAVSAAMSPAQNARLERLLIRSADMRPSTSLRLGILPR